MKLICSCVALGLVLCLGTLQVKGSGPSPKFQLVMPPPTSDGFVFGQSTGFAVNPMQGAATTFFWQTPNSALSAPGWQIVGGPWGLPGGIPDWGTANHVLQNRKQYGY